MFWCEDCRYSGHQEVYEYIEANYRWHGAIIIHVDAYLSRLADGRLDHYHYRSSATSNAFIYDFTLAYVALVYYTDLFWITAVVEQRGCREVLRKMCPAWGEEITMDDLLYSLSLTDTADADNQHCLILTHNDLKESKRQRPRLCGA